MTNLEQSWIESANSAGTQFPLNNLPYGVFSTPSQAPHCGVAIGNFVLDATLLETEGLIAFGDSPVLEQPSWNAVMALGAHHWAVLRARLKALLAQDGDPALRTNDDLRQRALFDLAGVNLHMPFVVSEYTDFYAGRHHAQNVGTMFRGPENALPPNWVHMPIGYNGRASSIVVSGTDIRRPWGQLKAPGDDTPHFAPSKRFDVELEMGAIVGTASDGPITVAQADANIFGYVLLNDWSARDIQAWEYQPLGPFQAKATATSISPWIVTAQALEPFRCHAPERSVDLLDHLQDDGPMLYDIDLTITLQPDGGDASTIATTNYNEMYYSAAQQLAHHTTSGCPMRVGDLLGSGTISGPEKHNRGSLLELSWGGTEPFHLADGTPRSFIEDGDTLTLHGTAKGDGYQIGFGDCRGRLIAAQKKPFPL